MALTTIDDRGLKTPIDLLDNEKIRFGTGNDLEIYHDASNSWIKNDTGNLKLSVAGGSNTVEINKGAVSEHLAKFIADGAVELYYDNKKSLETRTDGVSIKNDNTETFRFTGHILSGVSDSAKIYMGAGDDLQIYHDGTYNTFAGANFLVRNAAANETLIYAVEDGASELWYDNSKKLETTSTGAKTTGNITCTGDIGVGTDSPSNWGPSVHLKGVDPCLLLEDSATAVDYYGMNITAGAVTTWFDDSAYFTIGTASALTGSGMSEKLRIDSSGKVLLNTTAVTHTDDFLTIKRPAGNHYATTMSLDATSATANAANALIYTKSKDYYYNGLIFESSTGHQGGICGKMTASGGTTPQIELRIGGSSFASGDIAALTVYSNGDVGLGDGNLKVASTHGIDFSAATDVATGETVSSSVLDDYEEGSWNPAATSGFTNPSYSVQHGRYTKIGNQVSVWFYMTLNNANTITATGDNFKIGLPFAQIGSTMYNAFSGYSNGTANSVDNPVLIGFPNETNAHMYKQGDTGVSVVSGTDAGKATSQLWWATYQVS